MKSLSSRGQMHRANSTTNLTPGKFGVKFEFAPSLHLLDMQSPTSYGIVFVGLLNSCQKK